LHSAHARMRARVTFCILFAVEYGVINIRYDTEIALKNWQDLPV